MLIQSLQLCYFIFKCVQDIQYSFVNCANFEQIVKCVRCGGCRVSVLLGLLEIWVVVLVFTVQRFCLVRWVFWVLFLSLVWIVRVDRVLLDENRSRVLGQFCFWQSGLDQFFNFYSISFFLLSSGLEDSGEGVVLREFLRYV